MRLNLARPIRQNAGAAFALSLLSSTAFAEDVESKSRIEAVTLHLNGAVVERTAAVDLPAGDNVVILRGLPVSLEESSVRATLNAGGAAAIGAVTVRPAPQAPLDDSVVMARLTAEKKQLEIRMEAAKLQRETIRRSAQNIEKITALADIRELWKAVAPATEEARAREAAAELRIGEIDAEIAKIFLAGEVAPPPSTVDARVEMRTDAPARTSLRLSYRDAKAYWRPEYEARLDTKAKEVELVRRAIIQQTTGEDWKDVRLSVNFTSLRDADASQRLMTAPMGLASVGPGRESAPASRAGVTRDSVGGDEGAKPQSSFDAEIAVPGAATVKSEAEPTSRAIGSSRRPAELFVLTAPELTAQASLNIRFDNAGDRPLVAGPVRLYRDGAYVGRAAFEFVNRGAKAELYFGVDPYVRVTRAVVLDRKFAGNFLNRREGQDFGVEMEIVNNHDFAIPVLVEARLPVSSDPKLEVKEAENITAPTVRYDDDRLGVVGWSYDYKPGEKKMIGFGYRATWPEGANVQGPNFILQRPVQSSGAKEDQTQFFRFSGGTSF